MIFDRVRHPLEGVPRSGALPARAVRGAEGDGSVGACSAVSTFTLRLGSINERMNTPF
jgi:hypothetical protein